MLRDMAAARSLGAWSCTKIQARIGFRSHITGAHGHSVMSHFLLISLVALADVRFARRCGILNADERHHCRCGDYLTTEPSSLGFRQLR